MATFKKCDDSVNRLANEILSLYETHQPIVDAEVKIDFVFAYPEVDEESGDYIGDAIKQHGVKAIGLCRKLSLKDRAMGRGDAEISLDGEWWGMASVDEQRALLDHELHHIAVKVNKHGQVQLDDLSRPKLDLRKHDFQFGWFNAIAQRHGASSLEQVQAKHIMDKAGQLYWPKLLGNPVA